MEQNTFVLIGMNIARILKEKQKTQKQLADSLQISKQVMHKIIKGAKAVNAHELKLISTTLNVTVEDLLDAGSYDLEDQPVFGFMGHESDENSKTQVKKLQEAAEQISLLEELLHA